jgi:hypothetical protein
VESGKHVVNGAGVELPEQRLDATDQLVVEPL